MKRKRFPINSLNARSYSLYYFQSQMWFPTEAQFTFIRSLTRLTSCSVFFFRAPSSAAMWATIAFQLLEYFHSFLAFSSFLVVPLETKSLPGRTFRFCNKGKWNVIYRITTGLTEETFTATVSFILTLDSIYSENALSFNRNANITKLANYQEDINTSSCQLSNAEFVFFQIYNLRPVPFFFLRG